MKDIVIIGAGGLGREVANLILVLECNPLRKCIYPRRL
jgi:phosphoglycerate dehydrogenase-like enzyme